MPKPTAVERVVNGLSNKELRSIRRCARDKGVNKYLKPYIQKSRIIAQTIHPFMAIERMFYAGVPDTAKLEEEEEEEEPEKAEADNQEYTEDEVRAFKSIMKLERGFSLIVDVCSTDAGSFLGLIHLITEASGQSRGDDTSKLKTAILEYLYENPREGSKFKFDYEIEQLLSADHKNIRGFNHLDTADLLCPLSMRDEFERDPVAWTSKVIDGDIPIMDDEFPTFMYESGTEYNPDDLLMGFLRSDLLARVFRHIFTGPSTAFCPTNSPNKSKAKIFGLTKVTGEMIAYTCTYLALSSASKWKHFVDLFNLDDFYDSIIGLINENINSQWGKELLEWWGAQIPGLRSPMKKKKKQIARSDCRKKGPSQAELMQAQLRERELQLAQKERELEERERQLKQRNYRPRTPTPPRIPRQSTPHHFQANNIRPSNKQARSTFEDDENDDTESEQEGGSEDEGRPEGEDEMVGDSSSEAESQMEDEDDSRHIIQKGTTARRVNDRQADDEMEVDDEVDELINEYSHESKKFDAEKAKVLENLKASKAQSKEGRRAEKEGRHAEKEVRHLRRKVDALRGRVNALRRKIETRRWNPSRRRRRRSHTGQLLLRPRRLLMGNRRGISMPWTQSLQPGPPNRVIRGHHRNGSWTTPTSLNWHLQIVSGRQRVKVLRRRSGAISALTFNESRWFVCIIPSLLFCSIFISN
ncbi:hypothetical protein CPB84DRAFT_1958086 [Gymnopilus junonius]|uniref:Uncharacterized protein n=1 Tax=Gymnopilus junonius TaxID=109634 RepID=A0A9P5P0N3_GYMJU|nr:hypothetical protein CPB84DRAFT_1958086 [Gymnopilus junonius]